MMRSNTRGALPGALWVLAGLWMFQTAVNVFGALDSKGTEFLLAFPGNNSTPTAIELFITADADTSGTVSIAGLSFSQNFNVTAGQITTVALPTSTELNTSDNVSSKAVLVQAQGEVTVYGISRRTATTDAYLGLPVDILGTDYLVLAYKNVGVVNGTQFAVVGTQDNTTVTINLSATTGARTAGTAYTVALDRGQVYFLRNTINGNDFTGTVITSDKPIAVFGSHRCANIPNSNTTACDYLVEQLPPTNTWGQAFVTMPLKTRQNGDTFRFLASTDSTSVSINGTAAATLNRGQFHEQLVTSSASITSDHPILVAQYSNGTSFDSVTSDPFMMLIPPFEQFLGNYTVSTPSSGISLNHVNVVAPDAAVGNITLDGTSIPSASFQAIGTSGFSGAQLDITVGSHTLNSAFAFGAFVYGFDSSDSYGYPGGMSLAQVVNVTSLALTPSTANAIVGAQHQVIATVTDSNNNPVQSVRVDFTVTGANPTNGFALTGTDGQARFIYVGASAGMDTIRASVGALSDTGTVTFGQTSISAIIPNRISAAGGTTMTVIGNGLDTLTNLSAAGTALVDFRSTNATTATFTAPAHAAGTVDLTSTINSAQVTLLAKAYRYVAEVRRTFLLPRGSEAKDFKMAGIPLAGTQSNQRLAAQLLAQLDFTDPTVARIFRFNGATYDEGRDIPLDDFASGIGFWIISSKAVVITFEGSNTNQVVDHGDGTVSPDPPVVVFLHRGWNQVSPGLANLKVSPQRTFVSNGTIQFRVTDAGNTLTNQSFFEFTGDLDRPYQIATVLNGEEAYWIFNASNQTLVLIIGEPSAGNGAEGAGAVFNAVSAGMTNFLQQNGAGTPLEATLASLNSRQAVTNAVTNAASPPAPPAAVVSGGLSGSGGGSGGGCFIATAAYGTPLDSHIQSLSRFRDAQLLPTRPGGAFTKTYYANSPPAAAYLRTFASLRALARQFLRPVVRAAEE